MDSTTQLIIRACKSDNPSVRLRTVYRRFYLMQSDGNTDFYIAGILAKICDTYLNVSVAQMVSDLSPHSAWRNGITDEDSHWSAVIKVLTGYIRMTDRSFLPGLTPPAMFRKRPSLVVKSSEH